MNRSESEKKTDNNPGIMFNVKQPNEKGNFQLFISPGSSEKSGRW